jgi:hypothetical protein
MPRVEGPDVLKRILALPCFAWAALIVYNRFFLAQPTPGGTPYEQGKQLGQNMALIFAFVLASAGVYLLFSDSGQPQSRRRKGRKNDGTWNAAINPIWAAIVVAMIVAVVAIQFLPQKTQPTAAKAQAGVGDPAAQLLAQGAAGAPAVPPLAPFPRPIRGRNGVVRELADVVTPRDFAPPRLMADGKPELPENYVPVQNETPLVPGTPVKHFFIRWKDAVVISVAKEGKVKIREGISPFLRPVNRDDLAISAKTLESLNDPDAAARYAAVVKDAGFLNRVIQRFPMTIPIPDTDVQVTAVTPLTRGVPIKICAGVQWADGVVGALNSDGSVHIRYSALFEADVDRSDLIINKKVLEILRQRPKPPTAKQARERPKTTGGL